MVQIVALQDFGSEPGKDLGHSEWLEVTQERVARFAEATGDCQWIHVDTERANRELGGPIAHGYLILALIPLLRASVVQIAGVKSTLNYGCEKVRFLSPVRIGKRIRLRCKLVSVTPKSGAFLVKMECAVEIEGEAKLACVAETLSLVFASSEANGQA